VAAAVAIPASATAKAKLPVGHYTCTYYTYPIGTTFSNSMRVFPGKRYNADGSRKKKGRFVFRGEKIKFKSGPYKGVYYGKWEKGAGSEKELHLYIPDDDDDYALTCSRDR
jgi:hypothetical protein